jgi:hypothetical protein
VDISNPPNVEGTVRESLIAILEELGAGKNDLLGLESLMRIEAGVAALLQRADRPALFERRGSRIQFEGSLDQSAPKDMKVSFSSPTRVIDAKHRFDHLLGKGEIEVLGRVENGWSGVALAPWNSWVVRIVELGPVEREICRELTPDREVPLATLERRMTRLKIGREWLSAVGKLQRDEIVDVFE